MGVRQRGCSCSSVKSSSGINSFDAQLTATGGAKVVRSFSALPPLEPWGQGSLGWYDSGTGPAASPLQTSGTPLSIHSHRREKVLVSRSIIDLYRMLRYTSSVSMRSNERRVESFRERNRALEHRPHSADQRLVSTRCFTPKSFRWLDVVQHWM